MSYLLISSKHLITQQLQLCLLIIINGDKDNALIRQQLLGNLQALVHKREPLGVTVAVLGVHKRVVVDEVLVARIIRRIDIDDVYLSLMGIGEGGEGFQVVALNKDMVRGIGLVAQYRLVLHFSQNGQ